MSVTIRRPLYSGSGFALYNGSGLALSYEVTADSLEQAIYDLLTEVRAVLGGPNSTLASELLTVKNAVKVPPEAQAYYSNIWQVLKPLFDFYEPLVPYTAGWNRLFEAFIDNDTPAQVNAITPQVNTIVNTGVPATSLPNPPPAGYGGETAGDIADAVWGYLLAYTNGMAQVGNLMAGNLLAWLVSRATIRDMNLGTPDRRSPWFRWYSRDSTASIGPTFYDTPAAWQAIPTVDFSTVVEGDTVLSWLTREYPAWTWTTTAPYGFMDSGLVWALVLNEAPYVWLVCTLTDQELHHLTAATPAGGATPPIWPGAENVTFGAGVPLAAGVVIDVPLDGIELNILSSDRLIPYVGADTFKLYRSMGRVAFKSDDGYLEPWQPVPADQCVMCPKTMSRAAGVVLSFYTGVTGLVTPWTVSV